MFNLIRKKASMNTLPVRSSVLAIVAFSALTFAAGGATAGGLSDALKSAAQMLNAPAAKASAPGTGPAEPTANNGGSQKPTGATGQPVAFVSKTKAASFTEAQKSAVSEVRDGEPVYLYVQLPQLRCPRGSVASSSRVRSTRDGDRTDEEAIHRGADHWLPA